MISREPRLLTTAIACGAALLLAASIAQSARAASVASTQQVVALFAPHNVRAKADSSSAVTMRIPSTRPITGQRTKLPVLDRKTDKDGKLWLQVRTPGRANGQPKTPSKGWITADSTKRTQTVWHLTVDVSSRTLKVYRAGAQVKKYKTIVGASSTPTPSGEFFVEESVHMSKSAPGEPYALALSARSSVFQEFEGGPGQIAIHGRNGIGGTLGTAVSHGCIRASTEAVTWLAKHIGQGVPVTIKR